MASERVERIAVIGAGQMGSGIAQTCATAGYTVALCDLDEARAQAARSRIEAALEKATARGKLSVQAASEALARLQATNLPQALASADLVIEAVTEDPELKQRLFREIDAQLPPGALIASNTSSISITQLAACTHRPEQVIGLHFMNPVPIMKLVEIVLGERTSEETHQRMQLLVQQLGKTAVVSKDRPGFIVNRVLIPLLNEACLTLQEGVASAEDIDAAVRLGLAHPMGPLELADLIGLDTVLAITEVMRTGLHSDKYQAPALLKEKVDAGHLGRKTGEGFYRYDERGTKLGNN
ncbi:MAG TPA: 3-hydroxybutyryl-CoA dehydrogenase [Polyangiaceae bacterium]|nr:3-hydroxybutyryl-CoA dehydrogenase [Polyangiaceae bacterium]